ncbi:uncharacterized protein BO72DRAFT_287501 [Aspergillus fijiensis CBS 313.89]|uniref:Uncharacterized protein n=1 Tax=Aspergillus fijiensis CBS 313.89 TaxID=1448319 RepID=A0A8G1RWB6_9EURO|nr:uncharacterized protein BO72DRAFT_287501 [Aspergillus fijiensis CBS 313.89]RAK80735.1 hypothetical protein BO72DRAFT_287501 [Aspergillus fijiensis CBS 313.89]
MHVVSGVSSGSFPGQGKSNPPYGSVCIIGVFGIFGYDVLRTCLYSLISLPLLRMQPWHWLTAKVHTNPRKRGPRG